MFSRSLAFCSILVGASIAQAGATVQFTLTPAPLGPNGCYVVNTQVAVDVKILQDPGGSDQRIRMAEFDLANSNGSLVVTLPITHDSGTPGLSDDLHFWRFDSLAQCASTPSFCGFNQYVDDDLPAGPVDTRTQVLSAAYYGLAADATAQVLMPGGATPTAVTVGKLDLMTPGFEGTFTLNLMNAADADINRRARLDFGFDPHVIWRAGQAVPNDLKGGTQLFTVVSNPLDCGAPPGVNFVSSVPPFTAVGSTTIPTNGTLWRTTRQVIRLTFDGPLPVTPPTGTELDIVELLPAGAFGADLLPGTFQLTIEGGNVLKIRESATGSTVLADNHWYAIRNTGAWAGVANFEIHFPVNVGDSDGNRFTTPADVGQVNAAPNGPQPDNSRFDINGDAFKTPADVGLANANQGPPPAKPTGH